LSVVYKSIGKSNFKSKSKINRSYNSFTSINFGWNYKQRKKRWLNNGKHSKFWYTFSLL